MDHIKFVAKDQQEKQFTTDLRKNVKQYFEDNNLSIKGDSRLYIKTIVMVSLYIVPFIVMLAMPVPVWVAALLCVVMGIGVAGTGMGVMHDAVHGAYSHKVWVNKLMGGTLYLLGSNVLNWKLQHNVFHHAYTNVGGIDEDIDTKGPIRLAEQAPLKKIHYYQHIYAFALYGLLTISKLFKDFTQLARYNKAGVTKNYMESPAWEYTKMVVIKLAYLVAIIGLPIVFTSFTWWQVAIGFFIMHWTAGFILSTIFQMAHVVEGAEQPIADSAGHINHAWAVHELQTTSDFARNNSLVNWYVGGLNFQIEHHLFPNISHVHYRKISYIVERTAKQYGLNYNLKPSFRAAIRSHIVKLKELGRQPAYQH